MSVRLGWLVVVGGVLTLSDGWVRTAPLGEVARLVGWSRSRLYEVSRLPGFPAPVAFVACLPVFDVEEIRRFVSGGMS